MFSSIHVWDLCASDMCPQMTVPFTSQVITSIALTRHPDSRMLVRLLNLIGHYMNQQGKWRHIQYLSLDCNTLFIFRSTLKWVTPKISSLNCKFTHGKLEHTLKLMDDVAGAIPNVKLLYQLFHLIVLSIYGLAPVTSSINLTKNSDLLYLCEIRFL